MPRAPPSCSNRQSFGLLAASAAMRKVTTGVASRQGLTIAAPASTVTAGRKGRPSRNRGAPARPWLSPRSKPASKTRMISSSIAEPRGDRRAWPVSRVTCSIWRGAMRQRSLFSPSRARAASQPCANYGTFTTRYPPSYADQAVTTIVA